MLRPSFEPEEVFTPRRPDVNERMYVERSLLEQALTNAIAGTQHIVIHGESGTGKSWLYKRLFAKLEVFYQVGNLANASRFGSITKEIENLVRREGQARLTGFSEEKTASVSAVVAEGGLTNQRDYEIGQKEPFEECLQLLRKKAGNKRHVVLVLDNLESIFESETLMSELADLVILLDDERYAPYNVKLLIVGIPHHIRDYFNRTRNRAPVANRLYEIPEVSRLTEREARALVYRGFVDLLRYAFAFGARERVLSHVSWVTDRIPQRIHEYCLELARLARENGKTVTAELLSETDERWLAVNLSQAYAVIEKVMNERETKVGRRNQTIYALGQLKKAEFSIAEVEAIVRDQFPSSTFQKKLNIAGMLGELADGPDPLIRRPPKGSGYMFTDPLYRMCIRAMLWLAGEEVRRRPISRR